MSFFKKLNSNASNFFKKLPNTANNMYKKLSDVGGNIASHGQDFINKTIDTTRKAGSFLEKYSPTIATGLAGIATASGLGGLSMPIMGAGNYVAKLGRQLNNTGNQISDTHNQIQNHVNSIRNDVSNAPKLKLI
jgi:hypothetical protein